MTISELAKIALEEKRVVRAKRLGWKYWELSIDPEMDINEVFDAVYLAADDWYEVTSE